MFSLFKTKKPTKQYDPAVRKPAIRKSICTGEETAGFVELATGKFCEVMLIRCPEDLKAFCQEFGVAQDSIEIIF